MFRVNLQAIVIRNAVVVVVVDATKSWEVLSARPKMVQVVRIIRREVAALGPDVSDIENIVGAKLSFHLHVPLLNHAVLIVLVHGNHACPSGRLCGIEAWIAASRQRCGYSGRSGVAVAIVAAIHSMGCY